MNNDVNKNKKRNLKIVIFILLLAVVTCSAIGIYLWIKFSKKEKELKELSQDEDKVKQPIDKDEDKKRKIPTTPIDQYDKNKLAIDFYNDTVDFDFNNMGKLGIKPSRILTVPKDDESYTPKKMDLKNVVYSSDSILSLYTILSKNKENVAIIAAANEEYIGNGYSILRKYRRGIGNQEQALMSVVLGLLEANIGIAEKDSKGNLVIDNKRNYRYNKKSLRNQIWISENLGSKIPLELANDYATNNRNCKFFSTYVTLRYHEDKSILQENKESKGRVFVYSIAAIDNGKVKITNYQDVYDDVYYKLIACLNDAQQNNIKHLVLTIPGSGIFAANDKKYLAEIKRASDDAVSLLGGYFDTLVLSPKL
ncbi:hypothetical protein EHP00_257 [Ecytonucleospora hepatopenaei]|uniref:Uncharacterized protein n=1 Tax=Ecytonucleospora hepatopenaei TaxID=646526 RepID=A0A1W0E6M2_9MICR|nr:hypothetical protein EHP00_257 [Ecytonucleospora hepatopenaei]